jgi:hypothetical protein
MSRWGKVPTRTYLSSRFIPDSKIQDDALDTQAKSTVVVDAVDDDGDGRCRTVWKVWCSVFHIIFLILLSVYFVLFFSDE